jgi:hypothetical protein
MCAGSSFGEGGLSFEEIGEVLALSPRTAKRDWAVARLWLFKAINPATEPEES